MKKVIILFIVTALLVVIYFFSIKKTDSTGPQKISDQDSFESITIPSLRSRDYVSRIGELTKYSDKPSYISYFTNYLSDGLKINGLLTIPKSEKPTGGYPAIVFVHGYIPPILYKTTEKYTDYIDYLSRNGFVVFKIDLRGHSDSEGVATGAYYSEDYVIDTLNAYAALKSYNIINPKSVGLWGHSMAGNVTFRSFIVAKDIPALVVWGGAGYTYTDLQEYGIMDNSYRPPIQNAPGISRREMLRSKYGEFDPNNDFWKSIVPTNYLDGVTGAISLNHAVDDNVVSVEYSRNLDNILALTDIEHELNEYRSGGHNISGNAFNSAMQNTIKFFNEHLDSN